MYKQKFTDGWTEGRTDSRDGNTPRPYWPRGKNLNNSVCILFIGNKFVLYQLESISMGFLFNFGIYAMKLVDFIGIQINMRNMCLHSFRRISTQHDFVFIKLPYSHLSH